MCKLKITIVTDEKERVHCHTLTFKEKRKNEKEKERMSARFRRAFFGDLQIPASNVLQQQGNKVHILVSLFMLIKTLHYSKHLSELGFVKSAVDGTADSSADKRTV